MRCKLLKQKKCCSILFYSGAMAQDPMRFVARRGPAPKNKKIKIEMIF